MATSSLAGGSDEFVARSPLGADATAMFAAWKIQEAASAWKLALRRLLPRVTAALDAAGDVVDAPESGPVVRFRGTCTVHPLTEDSYASSDWSSVTSGDRTFAVYASAIEYHASIPRSSATAAAGLLADDLAMAATSLFNLGLCHHLQALLRGDRATACYDKALKAYDAAQRILEGAGLFDGLSAAPWAAPQQHHHELHLLMFALTNNVGHVLDQLHAHDAAHQQLVLLHVLAASLRRTSTNASEAGPFAPFLLTAALHPPHHRGCPHPAPCA
jgi:tetratricopeptide (TPR) repeat protein